MVKILKDPGCAALVHGKLLTMPLSHGLPLYLSRYPLYDRLPGRLSSFLHEQYGPLVCVDVGANIGDSIAAFQQDPDDRFLAIEPNPHFLNYLKANHSSNPNVEIISCLCSSTDGRSRIRVREQRGTASLIADDSGHVMQSDTLDNLVVKTKQFSNVHLLKVDTDGHDFDVLAGARQMIAQGLPAILFECDVFENLNYVKDCLATLSSFYELGYRSCIVYDNVGNILGSHSLSDLSSFRNLLFCQLTKRFLYFDILVMRDPDLASFLETEYSFFVSQIPDQRLRRIACMAAGIAS